MITKINKKFINNKLGAFEGKMLRKLFGSKNNKGKLKKKQIKTGKLCGKSIIFGAIEKQQIYRLDIYEDTKEHTIIEILI